MTLLNRDNKSQLVDAKRPGWILKANTLNAAQRDALKGKKIMIGTPMYGGQCMGGYASSMLSFATSLAGAGVQVSPMFLQNESLVQRARNTIANVFMRGDNDYLFFIDADICFGPHQAIELLLASIMLNHPLIGASYTLKTLNLANIIEAAKRGVATEKLLHYAGTHVAHTEGRIEYNLFEPFAAKYLGTGFMLIHRSVFEKLRDSGTIGWYHNNQRNMMPWHEKCYSYFDCEIDESKIYLSEDYLFCARLSRIGLAPMLCAWIDLKHAGTFIYEGCFPCSTGSFVHAFPGDSRLQPKPAEPSPDLDAVAKKP